MYFISFFSYKPQLHAVMNVVFGSFNRFLVCGFILYFPRRKWSNVVFYALSEYVSALPTELTSECLHMLHGTARTRLWSVMLFSAPSVKL